ncbi:MAG: alpha/beta hydrolase [Alphaproteobacteria bacterium]|nr:alpha/beta hydrolase [Alphaproteobacteria bacterium]
MTRQPATLERNGTIRIAHFHTPGITPGVVFCTGFKSDMSGNKALALARHCRAQGRQMTRFDYQGHGQSSGDFLDGTIGEWLADTLAVLDSVTTGPQIVVGSSLGGWIGLLAAIARPERVRGFIGIAPAIDMTRRLWQRADDAVKARLRRDGVWIRPSEYDPAGYPITLRLIEEGDDHLLLPGPIPFDGPVRLLHGQRDDAVPWRLSLEIAEALRSDRVEVSLIKDGDHRLSGDADIARLLQAVETIAGQLDTA